MEGAGPRWTGLETAGRDALLAAILPRPGPGWPPLAQVDLSAFWPRFHGAAPFHIRVGFRFATVMLAVLLPLLLGQFRTLAALDDAQREAVIVRASTLPLFRELVEVAKLVASLAYFSDAGVQAIARGRP